MREAVTREIHGELVAALRGADARRDTSLVRIVLAMEAANIRAESDQLRAKAKTV